MFGILRRIRALFTRKGFRCGTHGFVRHAFVCGHLVDPTDGAAPLAWFRSNEESDVEPTEDFEVGCMGHFWCGACDARLRRDGEWTEEAMRLADARLQCEFCLEKTLARHVPGTD
jgi:hypothetical protein